MRKAAWVLPDFAEGSGGHRTIFQTIAYLSEHTYQNDVYVQDNGHFKNVEDLKKKAAYCFGTCNCRFYLGYQAKGSYDIIFATSWKTAAVVAAWRGEAKKAYVIQDFEALFYPMGGQYLAACLSYTYDLHFITIGRWLSQKLTREYGKPAAYFDFCADAEMYYDRGRKRKPAVCFLYQPEKPRRCSRLGIEALRIVKKLRPDVEIYLYGSNYRGKIGFCHKNLKLISTQACNRLYNYCSVGLCISSSNPSRVPFEMMAAGLPVVDLYLENNLYDMPAHVSLAMYEPQAIAQAVLQILDNKAYARQLAAGGKEYMKKRTLAYGFNQFYQAAEHVLSEDTKKVHPNVSKGMQTEPVEKIYPKPPITAGRQMQQSRWTDQSNTDVFILRYFKSLRFLKSSRLVQAIYRLMLSVYRMLQIKRGL